MGYVLLWIENLAASLLLTALVLACAARLSRGPWRVLLVTLAIVLPLFAYGCLTAADAEIEFAKRVELGWFWPLLMLALAFLAGSLIVLRAAMRRSAGNEAPAALWSRAKLAVALFVVLILHVMTFLNLDEAAKKSLVSLRSEAAARAISAAPPRLEDQDNAAILYLKVFAALGAEATNRPPAPPLWNDAEQAIADTSDDQQEEEFDFGSPEWGELLTSRAGELLVLHEAAKRPGCYFEREYAHPSFEMLLPETQELRNCSRLLALHARHSKAQGDLAAALSDLNNLYAVARHASTEPILVCLLVSAAIDHLADHTLQEILRSTNATSPTLEQLQLVRWPDSSSYRRLVRRTILMEEAFALGMFAELEHVDFNAPVLYVVDGFNPNQFGRAAPLYRVFLLDSDLAAYRYFMHDVLMALERPNFAESKRDADELDKMMSERRPGLLTSLLTPSVVGSCQVSFTADARHAVARVGIAMHVHRAKHGKFPDKLAELSPGDIELLP